MNDPFHEAYEALNVAKQYFTQVGSLSAMAAYSANQACENSVRALWTVTTGEEFPHHHFKPFHNPTLYIRNMGLMDHYSSETQNFLNVLEGMALDDVRYDKTQAYRDYTKPNTQEKSKKLIKGTEKFIEETKNLSNNRQVIAIVYSYKSHIDST